MNDKITLDLSNMELDDMTLSNKLKEFNNKENIYRLNLRGNELTKSIDVSSFTNLEELDLTGNDIEDFSWLETLKNLTKVWLSDSQVNDISFVQNLKNLKALYLTSTPISNLNPIAGCENLEELSISDTKVSDVSPLLSLGKLKKLYATDTELDPQQIFQLTALLNLTELYVNDELCSVADNVLRTIKNKQPKQNSHLQAKSSATNKDNPRKLSRNEQIKEILALGAAFATLFMSPPAKQKQSTTYILTNENFHEKLISAKSSFFAAIDKEPRAQEAINEIVTNMVEEYDYSQDKDSLESYNKL